MGFLSFSFFWYEYPHFHRSYYYYYYLIICSSSLQNKRAEKNAEKTSKKIFSFYGRACFTAK